MLSHASLIQDATAGRVRYLAGGPARICLNQQRRALAKFEAMGWASTDWRGGVASTSFVGACHDPASTLPRDGQAMRGEGRGGEGQGYSRSDLGYRRELWEKESFTRGRVASDGDVIRRSLVG
jgi:hypothetical protein